VTIIDRVDRIDSSLFDRIEGGLASSADRRSLLAIHAAVAARGAFRYLEIGSYLGASLQTFISDPRCTAIVSIDRRDAFSPDSRPGGAAYPDNTTERMCDLLAQVPGAELDKLTALDASTESLDPDGFAADLCLIDGEHTNVAALRDARFCWHAMSGRGVIVFHDRVIVAGAIRRFLAELEGARAYPLSHELFVVELGVPTLLRDPRLRAQVPHSLWTAAACAGVTSQLLALGPVARQARRLLGRAALTAGAPRRTRRVMPTPAPAPVTEPTATFELNTFVNDEHRYAAMRASFAEAGFDSDAFVQLSDRDDDPFRALTRLGQRSDVRYPILCHQDLLADLGAGAAELESALRYLDRVAPHWAVAGSAGIMRSGRLIRRALDVRGGFTWERLPLPVVTIDEVFVVLNPRNAPSCSPGAAGFHLYGTDVCLRTLAAGGGAYVIDFPLTHVDPGPRHRDQAYWDAYQRARASFCESWNPRSAFRYVITTSDAIFLSRSRLLRRVFGAPWILTSVTRRRAVIDTSDMRWIDCALAQPALRSIPKPLLDVDPDQSGVQPRQDPI
jgi:hypothetical protein